MSYVITKCHKPCFILKFYIGFKVEWSNTVLASFNGQLTELEPSEKGVPAEGLRDQAGLWACLWRIVFIGDWWSDEARLLWVEPLLSRWCRAQRGAWASGEAAKQCSFMVSVSTAAELLPWHPTMRDVAWMKQTHSSPTMLLIRAFSCNDRRETTTHTWLQRMLPRCQDPMIKIKTLKMENLQVFKSQFFS